MSHGPINHARTLYSTQRMSAPPMTYGRRDVHRTTAAARTGLIHTASHTHSRCPGQPGRSRRTAAPLPAPNAQPCHTRWSRSHAINRTATHTPQSPNPCTTHTPTPMTNCAARAKRNRLGPLPGRGAPETQSAFFAERSASRPPSDTPAAPASPGPAGRTQNENKDNT